MTNKNEWILTNYFDDFVFKYISLVHLIDYFKKARYNILTSSKIIVYSSPAKLLWKNEKFNEI